MTETTEEYRPFAALLPNVYLTILALFCFKLFVRITLNLLTQFYIIKGNRREAARISADFYGNGQGHGSWGDLSPLHDAASQGRLLALKTLIAQGHSVNVLTIDHISPLHEACIGSHLACARALIDAGANVNVTTIDGVTPLFNACSAGSLPCLELLLQSDARPQALAIFQPSPIHETVSRGHFKCLEVLVAWGVDADYEIPHMGTPLYSACRCREFLCARKLLDGGANVQRGTNMETPLHAAAQKDCVSIVKLLLEYGADINARNMEYKRPVEVAPPGSFTEGFLLIYEATPRSLNQLSRQQIRESLGRSRLHLIPHLPLPKSMKDFLQYK
ncbi:Ankyrin repeat and SOCS box protein 5 [Triplophysa tibetana]|uniref:Ankyrin repeat and SOCS box protein 5 n=1 Tax=Triplophysa tibetana TaxID=1572043 RepID=A0A5A9NKF6_9TELE|nr:Ankyrin repeat and SOCS box protein 5 [Triplophysa tibetana]